LINRYNDKKISKVFSNQARIDAFLMLEKLVLEAYHNLGYDINLDSIKDIKIDFKEVEKEEEITKHDVFSFINVLSKKLGNDAKYLHHNLTSTDLVDSAYSIMINNAFNQIFKDIDDLLRLLRNLSLYYKDTPILGRTHGMDADITSFGLKYLNLYLNLERVLGNLIMAKEDLCVIKLSGAVGSYSTIDPRIEEYVSKKLKLNASFNSTQVLPRGLHANFIFQISLFIEEIAKFSLDMRLLSTSSIAEVSEYFSNDQKGSSAMPQKRNPINFEQICGLARVSKSFVGVSLDNISLFLERDISHSSNERIIIEDQLVLLSYIVKKFSILITNMNVDVYKMRANISNTYETVFSTAVLSYLVEKKNYLRLDAYEKIKKYCNIALNEKKTLSSLLKENNLLNEKEIEDIFDIKNYLKNIDYIYKKNL